MRKNILLLATCVSALCLQSCFQDMNRPDFDYPASTGEVPTTPLKMYLPFDDDDIRDKGEYGFIVADNGNAKFVLEGVNGSAYQGASNAYALARTPSSLADVIPNIGSCTVSFWMKSVKNTSAYGLFSIPNTKTFWGNFDIYLENHSSETEAFFKIHLYNCTDVKDNDEKWVEAKVPDVFGSEWVHMAFVYDETTSTFTVYRNGEAAVTKELPGYGPLKFKDAGESLAIGAFQFSTTPSLTEGATAQSWSSNYPGQLDQFRLYDKALTVEEIQQLYNNKE